MSTIAQQPVSTVTRSQVAVAYSVCRAIARKAAKNFYYGFLLLPRAKHNALSAVYAFMRHSDDISDEPGIPLNERRERLAAWLDAVHRAIGGEPTDDPVLIALTDAVQRFSIPVGLLNQLVEGTQMDVNEDDRVGTRFEDLDAPLVVSYQSFDDLYRYCYHVASVVGLVCIRIFGYRDPAAERLAERCGVAFQLTNIIRDVKEDAGMGRVYLPAEDLARFGIGPDDLRRAPVNVEKIRPLLAMEADRARDYYNSAHELIPLIDDDSQPALWVLVEIYRRLLEKISESNYDVFHSKIRVSTATKLGVLARGFARRLT
ncbi:MAG TPA: phytoene/squalene synthase family protein [Terriglobales bacterium]|nr:phytoene/squalene synthase family protein [Terriglobales bacterium]